MVQSPSDLHIDPEHPWLGLRSYGETAEGYFFGRSAEKRDLFERVQHRPLTVLFGQSGLGKTSLLQAGLIPELRKAGMQPVVVRLAYEERAPEPEAQLISALQRAIDRDLPRELPLWLLLHDPIHGICQTPTPEFKDAGSRPKQPVLVLDQFEEIFTLGARRRETERLLRESLAVLVENRPPVDLDDRLAADEGLALRLRYEAQPVRVVLSLRDDFLHALERWKKEVPSVMENRLELLLLNGRQAFEAVVEPGKIRCRSDNTSVSGNNKATNTPIVADATGEAIVRFVAGVAKDVPLAEIDAVPPLLSLLCTELNERRTGPEETIHADQLQGRAEDILQDFYDRTLVAHPAAVRQFVEDALLSADGYRLNVTWGHACHELTRGGVTREDAEESLDRLINERLLISDERGGARRVELTHDILCPIAQRSRDSRQKEEDIARRRKARARFLSLWLSLIFAGVSVPLMFWALIEKRAAVEAKEQSEVHLVAAQEASEVARKAVSQTNRLLEQIARTDCLVAKDRADSGDSKTALAYLERALRYLPKSSFAAEAAMPLLLSQSVTFPRWTSFHPEFVTSAVFSPDGTRILTSDRYNVTRLWDAEAGTSVAEFKSHSDTVTNAVFSPDGRHILTASADHTARLWDAHAGTPVAEFRGHSGAVTSAVFSPDGRRILTASADHTARLWDAQSSAPLAELTGHSDVVTKAVFSPDGTRILTTGRDNTTRLWDSQSGAPLAELKGQPPVATGAVFNPDGTRILTIGRDNTPQLWDSRSSAPLAELKGQSSLLTGAMFSLDGTRILTTDRDGTTRFWNAQTGVPLVELRGPSNFVTKAMFSPDGTRILTTGRDNTTRLWDSQSGVPLTELRGPSEFVTSAVLSPDGTRILTIGRDSTPRLWNAQSGAPLVELKAHSDAVTSAVFSPDGRRILTASADHTARLWDAQSGAPLAEFKGHSDAVTKAVFSYDGTRILTLSNDQVMRLWDATVDAPPVALKGHLNAVESAVYAGRRTARRGWTPTFSCGAVVIRALLEPGPHSSSSRDRGHGLRKTAPLVDETTF